MLLAIAALAGKACIAGSIDSVKRGWRQWTFSSAQDRQIDPIGEAEVYMAYGRIEDAIFVLKDALKHEPNNTDIKITLLQAYAQEGHNQEFCDLVNHLSSELKDHPIWEVVCSVGQSLEPSNPLFRHDLN